MEERTEEADGIPLVIILHEELVTVYNMLAEIPCEHEVKSLGRVVEN